MIRTDKTPGLSAITSRPKSALRAKNRVPLQLERADGSLTPLPPDPHADDPGDLAAVREQVRGRCVLSKVEACLPSPEEVVAKVIVLRTAMFAAIDVEGVTETMKKVMELAKATRLLIDLLAPRAAIAKPR
jgi:hypothetical protein